MRQVLSNHRKYVAPPQHLNNDPLIHRRFRILVVGKVHSRHSQPNSGQIDALITDRLRQILARQYGLQSEHTGLCFVVLRIPILPILLT